MPHKRGNRTRKGTTNKGAQQRSLIGCYALLSYRGHIDTYQTYRYVMAAAQTARNGDADSRK